MNSALIFILDRKFIHLLCAFAILICIYNITRLNLFLFSFSQFIFLLNLFYFIYLSTLT